LEQTRKLNLPTEAIEARIAALEKQQSTISIGGDVGAGAVVGDGNVQADSIAGRDVWDFRNATINTFIAKQPGRAAQFREYLVTLMAERGRLPQELFDSPDDESRLRLWRVYTALDVWHTPPQEMMRQLDERTREGRLRRPVLAAANEHDRLVLLGGPGTGKDHVRNLRDLVHGRCDAGARG
jgi:hypothetical protein